MIKINTNTQEILLDDTPYNLEEVSKALLCVPCQNVVEQLLSVDVKLTRKVRMDAMRISLRPGIVRTRSECLTLDSQLNYRLLWFNMFSEEQMSFYFDYFKDKDLNRIFATKFYRNLLIYLASKEEYQQVAENITRYGIENLENTAKDIKVKDFLKCFNPFFIDEQNTIDGLVVDKFRPVIYNSATKQQVDRIAQKYDIDIPAKINKATIGPYVLEKLMAMGVDVSEFEEKMPSMQVKEIREFAQSHGLETSGELNKKEMIEYILQRAPSTKNEYVCPTSDRVYEMNIPISDEETVYEKILVEQVKLQKELDEKTQLLKKKHGEELEKAMREIEEKEKEKLLKEEELQKMQVQLEQDLANDSSSSNSGAYEKVIAEEYNPDKYIDDLKEITDFAEYPSGNQYQGAGALVVYETQRQDIMVLETTRSQKTKKFGVLAILLIIIISVISVAVAFGIYAGVTKLHLMNLKDFHLEANSTLASAPDKDKDSLGKLKISPVDFEESIKDLKKFYKNSKETVTFEFQTKNGNNYKSINTIDLKKVYQTRKFDTPNTDYYVKVIFLRSRKYIYVPLEINFKNIITIYGPRSSENVDDPNTETSTYIKYSDYNEQVIKGKYGSFQTYFAGRLKTAKKIDINGEDEKVEKDLGEWYLDSQRTELISEKIDVEKAKNTRNEIRVYASNSAVEGKNIFIKVLGCEQVAGFSKYLKSVGDGELLTAIDSKIVYPGTKTENKGKEIIYDADSKKVVREFFKIQDFVLYGDQEKVFTTNFTDLKTELIKDYDPEAGKIYEVVLKPRFVRTKVVLKFFGEDGKPLSEAEGENKIADVTVTTDLGTGKYSSFAELQKYNYGLNNVKYFNYWKTDEGQKIDHATQSIPGYDVLIKDTMTKKDEYIVKCYIHSGLRKSLSVQIPDIHDYKVYLRETYEREGIEPALIPSKVEAEFSRLNFNKIPDITGKEDEKIIEAFDKYFNQESGLPEEPSEFGGRIGLFVTGTDHQIDADATFGNFSGSIEIRYLNVSLRVSIKRKYYNKETKKVEYKTYEYVRYVAADGDYENAHEIVDTFISSPDKGEGAYIKQYVIKGAEISDKAGLKNYKVRTHKNDVLEVLLEPKFVVVNFKLDNATPFDGHQDIVFLYDQEITADHVPEKANEKFKYYLLNGQEINVGNNLNTVTQDHKTTVDLIAEFEARKEGSFALTRVLCDEKQNKVGGAVVEEQIISQKNDFELGKTKTVAEIFPDYASLASFKKFPIYCDKEAFEYDSTATEEQNSATPTDDNKLAVFKIYFKRKTIKVTFTGGQENQELTLVYGQFINKGSVETPVKVGEVFADKWSCDGVEIAHERIADQIAGYNYSTQKYGYRPTVTFIAQFRETNVFINAYYVKTDSENNEQALDTSDTIKCIKFSVIRLRANQQYEWNFDVVEKTETLNSLGLDLDYIVDDTKKIQIVPAESIKDDGAVYNIALPIKRKKINITFQTIKHESDGSETHYEKAVSGDVYADTKGFKTQGVDSDPISLALKDIYENFGDNRDLDSFRLGGVAIQPAFFIFSIANNGSENFVIEVINVPSRGSLAVYIIYTDGSTNKLDERYCLNGTNKPIEESHVIKLAKSIEGNENKVLLDKKVTLNEETEIFPLLDLKDGYTEFTNPFGEELGTKKITLTDKTLKETYIFIKRAKYTVRFYIPKDNDFELYATHNAYCGATVNDYQANTEENPDEHTGSPILPPEYNSWVYKTASTKDFDTINTLVYQDLDIVASK